MQSGNLQNHTHGSGKTARSLFSADVRAELLPPKVAATMRTFAAAVLSESTRNQLIVLAAARGLRPTEIVEELSSALDEIEAILQLDAADREAALAEIENATKARLQPFDFLLAQIVPTRRATVVEYADGKVRFNPADAATARTAMSAKDATSYARRTNCPLKPAKPTRNKPPNIRRMGLVVCACHTCKWPTTERCLTCKRIGQDDIRIERSPKNERPELTREIAPPNPGADPPPAVPSIEPQTEDTLRKFLATVTELTPLQFLSVVFTATRRPNFQEFLRQFAEEIATYDSDESGRRFSRAGVHAALSSIFGRTPALATLRTWKKGHGGGGRKARDEGNPDGDPGEIENQQVEDMSRHRDLGEERSQEETNYWFDDGDGREL